MKKIILLLLNCVFVFNLSAQTDSSKIYKIYKHPSENSRSGSEDIILNNDGSFCVFSAIGGMGISYRGGWWETDTLLVLHPSLNCSGPVVLDKTESRDNGSDELFIEIYNEKGFLKYYGCSDHQDSIIKIIKNDGCIIQNLKEGVLFRYFDIVIKGKSLSGIKTRKRNNKIICVVLEPTSSDDVYWGKRTIPFSELEEDNDNPLYKQ